MGDPVELDEIGPRHLDPDRALDAGRQHIDAVADWRNPDIGEAGEFQRTIPFFNKLVGCHPRPPLVAGFELNVRLETLQRRRLGGGLGASGLSEYALDFGHGLADPVGLLEPLRRLYG